MTSLDPTTTTVLFGRTMLSVSSVNCVSLPSDGHSVQIQHTLPVISDYSWMQSLLLT